MMRRGWLWLCTLLFSPCILAATTQPNVVIFLLDDVGQSDVGAFGNTVVHTPNIDQIARDGVRFDNAFLTTSSCSPSRASLLTGLYPTATGAPKLDDPLPAAVTSLPQLLHDAGYYTASVGKWHLGEPFKVHFDRVVEPREESGAADWLPELARRPRNKPFFFWLASKDAHSPYETWHPPLLHQNPRTVPLSTYDDDNAFVREAMAGYYDEIARADRNIGLVIEALRKEGILDNTLIMVLSDNGSEFGGAKTTLYDEGIKTPLVMRLPAVIPANIANQQLVSAVDLMPTVLAMAGLPAVPNTPGVSLLPTLQNPAVPVRNYIYAERNQHGQPHFSRIIRTQNFLYKRNFRNRKLCNPYWDTIWERKKARDARHAELYDLQNDPSAMHNLLGNSQYKSQLIALHAIMQKIMAETQQDPPKLIMESCPQRPWANRIDWPLSLPENE
ncbi:MAG: sulfatase [Pseudomonadales bacterium]